MYFEPGQMPLVYSAKHLANRLCYRWIDGSDCQLRSQLGFFEGCLWPASSLALSQPLAWLSIRDKGRPHGDTLLMVLWLITNILSNIFIKNWLRLRARAHGHA